MTKDLDHVYKTFIDLRNAGRNAHLKMRYEGGKTFASLELELSEKGIDGTPEMVPDSQRQDDKTTEIGLELAHPKTVEEVPIKKRIDTQCRDIGIQVEACQKVYSVVKAKINTVESDQNTLEMESMKLKLNGIKISLGTLAYRMEAIEKATNDALKRVVNLPSDPETLPSHDIDPYNTEHQILPRRTFLKSGESHDNEYPRRTFESEKISWKSAQKRNPLGPQTSPHRKSYSFKQHQM